MQHETCPCLQLMNPHWHSLCNVPAVQNILCVSSAGSGGQLLNNENNLADDAVIKVLKRSDALAISHGCSHFTFSIQCYPTHHNLPAYETPTARGGAWASLCHK